MAGQVCCRGRSDDMLRTGLAGPLQVVFSACAERDAPIAIAILRREFQGP
jgi:hypothetical protein